MQNLLVSLGCLALTASICRVARVLVDSLVKDKFHQVLAFEFVTTFELCASVFEIGVIMENYGFLAYTCLMLFMFNYWGTVWGSATASPCPHVLDIVLRKTDLITGLKKVLAQICAGVLVYQIYVKHVWSLGYQDKHTQRIATASQCRTHLQVSLIQGIFVEALCIFVFLTAAKTLGRQKYAYIAMPLSLVSVVYSGMTLTGAWFNPILASTIQFGCGGISPLHHFMVYWVGPILGCIANHFTFDFLQRSKILKLD